MKLYKLVRETVASKVPYVRSTQNSVNIECFRAIDNLEYCHQYVVGHTNVLKGFGLTRIASSDPIWMYNPMVYCVVASIGGQMVGGIRIHKADGITPLPLEVGVGHIDGKVILEIRKYLTTGVGEQCGLWNSSRVKGYGISWILVNSSIAVLNVLNIKKLYGLASDYSMFLFTPAGFRIQRSFGSNGDFIYPSNDYIARVVRINNCKTLRTTFSKELDFIRSLRNNPNLISTGIITDMSLKLAFKLGDI